MFLAVPGINSPQELLDPLHCIEFFAGENGSAKIAKCFKHLGCLVQAFDLSRSSGLLSYKTYVLC